MKQNKILEYQWLEPINKKVQILFMSLQSNFFYRNRYEDNQIKIITKL